MTSADMPDPGDRIAELGEGAIRLSDLSSNCLARDKVLYRGQAVAAVAAVNAHVAEEGLGLIKVDYEPLPFVTDVRKAMEPSAPLLHEKLQTKGIASASGKPSNIAEHSSSKRATSTRASPRRQSSSSTSMSLPRSTRAISSRTMRPHSGTPMAP